MFSRYESIPDEFWAAEVTANNLEELAKWGKSRFPEYTWSFFEYGGEPEEMWIDYSDENWCHFAMIGDWLVIEEDGELDIIRKHNQDEYRKVAE